MSQNDGLLEALIKRAVWNKGLIIAGYDPNVWRQDVFGHVIRFSDSGDRMSPYGWEKDHIFPKALGGADSLDNLRPLHCKNNAGLGGILGRALSSL